MSPRLVICSTAAAFVATATMVCAEPRPPAKPTPLAAQEAGLRISLASTAAVILHADEAFTVRFPVRLSFVPDRTELLPAGIEMLDLLARSLREYERTQIVVAVYTDRIGTSEFNQQQALVRAVVVAAYLQSKGIAAGRFVNRGEGESAPLEAPDTPEGRELNRRLELTITPLSS